MATALPTPQPPDNQRPLHEHSNADAGGTDSTSNSELFISRAFKENPVQGYELLFKRYYASLCSHAARFVYDRQVAEDVVVDVFAQFWQKRLDQTITTSYRAYLFTMVRHRAFAHLRQEFGRETSAESQLDNTVEDSSSTPLQVLQFNELHLKIDEIIRSASPYSQKVFVMSRFEGKKNLQIANELSLSIKTVEGHITKVLALLRQELRKDGLISLGLFLTGWLGIQALSTFLGLCATATEQTV